jgi:aminocarboxymuconate-semialdehyde decarboxylase
MIVDAHAHLVPKELISTIQKERARFASLQLIEEPDGLAMSFAGSKPTRPVAKGLSDVQGRLAWMDKQGIDRQVVGGWVDIFGYQLPAAEGETWSRLTNEVLLAAAKAEPRFAPLATVPLQDGTRAAAVLKAAMRDGFSGTMIATLPRDVGSTLDDPDLDAFWAAADETGAVVHIHPSFDAGDTRVGAYGLANAVGRISDALVAVARLVCSGHATRYPNAKIFAPMGAGGLPFVIGRLQRNAQITPGVADPIQQLSRVYFDSILHDSRVLRFVVGILGTERLMMGSDSPFPIGDMQPMRIVEEAGLTADQVASINGSLAAKLFRLT